MYSEDDLVHQEPSTRRKGVSAKPGEKKPRIQLDRETFIGRITSHRRSRRVINNTQMIVQLENDFNSDQIVGQNIYFRYPHTNQRVAGRISKRFGKSSSRKVIAKFPKGIATQAHNAKIFIK